MLRKMIVLCIGFCLVFSVFCSKVNEIDRISNADAFVGQWALDLPNGAGWLGVNRESGELEAELLWYGGSVTPVASAELKGDTLVVTRSYSRVLEKDGKGYNVRTLILTSWYEFWRHGDNLIGVARMPRRNTGFDEIKFTGKKSPELPDPTDLSQIKYGESVTLFNGKDLTGWKIIDPESKNGFKVEDGVLINDPVQPEEGPHIRYGNLRTVQEFGDFNLEIDVNVPKGSNSGIYLRGIYEVQVSDSYGRELDSHHMGGIYSRIAPTVSAEKPAGEWQTFDITLCDRHVTVNLNGTMIINNQPLLGVTGGALTADEFSPGPIYLQGDHGKVSYRNIVLTPIVN